MNKKVIHQSTAGTSLTTVDIVTENTDSLGHKVKLVFIFCSFLLILENRKFQKVPLSDALCKQSDGFRRFSVTFS